MKELISIIVPVYNVERYLGRCIESIINQSYRNIEIILVDDGSTDSSPSICDAYSEKDERITVIHQKNSGLSEARNTGLDNANGGQIMFVDSDDTVSARIVEELIRIKTKYRKKLSACCFEYVFENGTHIRKVKKGVEKVLDFDEAIIEMNRYYYYDMSANGKLYDADLFKDIRFPKGKLSEDFFVMPEILKKSDGISYTSNVSYNYLQRKNSITRNKKINEDFLEAAKHQMDILKDEDEKVVAMCHVAYASAALTVYDFYLKNKVKCPNQKKKQYKKVIVDNWPYINTNQYIDFKKRFQLGLFKTNTLIYSPFFKIYKKLNRI